jgi:hypothetical protein
MPHVSAVMIAAMLFTFAAVNVIAARAKMDAKHHYAAPVISIPVALPSGMKSFPVELPQ